MSGKAAKDHLDLWIKGKNPNFIVTKDSRTKICTWSKNMIFTDEKQKKCKLTWSKVMRVPTRKGIQASARERGASKRRKGDLRWFYILTNTLGIQEKYIWNQTQEEWPEKVCTNTFHNFNKYTWHTREIHVKANTRRVTWEYIILTWCSSEVGEL